MKLASDILSHWLKLDPVTVTMVNKTKGNADYISTLGDEEQEDRIRAGKYTQDESAIVIRRWVEFQNKTLNTEKSDNRHDKTRWNIVTSLKTYINTVFFGGGFQKKNSFHVVCLQTPQLFGLHMDS